MGHRAQFWGVSDVTPKYNLGDVVWRATFGVEEAWVTCPDCGGTGRLRVTFHDETQVSIECRNCSVGYAPPLGQVKVYDRVGKAECLVVEGIVICDGGFEYNRWQKEADLFATVEEAQAAAAAMAVQWDADERAKIATKEKDT